jgi:hypothetical protein
MRRLRILAAGLMIALSGGRAVDASVPPDDGLALELGLGDITLVAPATTGAGTRPAFVWEPVPGAESYTLAVLSTDDVPLWAWYGNVTEVILGGWPELPVPAAPGPRITVPSKWFVVAYDAAGVPIANSDFRLVAP